MTTAFEQEVLDSASADSNVARGDDGFTMIELVISMSILLIVMTMSMAVLLSTQKATQLVSWQSNANSELRQFADSLTAELETARPRTLCKNQNGTIMSTMPQTCSRPVEGDGSPLESAGEKHVCYLSHREAPASFNSDAFSSTSSGTETNNYHRVCVAIIGTTLYRVAWAINGTDVNSPVVSNVEYLVIGEVDPDNSSFTYWGKTFAGGAETSAQIVPSTTSADQGWLTDDPKTYIPGSALGTKMKDKQVAKTVSGGRVTGAIAGITRVRVVLAVRTKDLKRSRKLEYDVSLRGAVFQNERCYTGERTVDSNGNVTCA